MRAKIASAGLPAGLRVHLAGSIAVQVDQQKASGNTGNKVQDLSLIFIIVLLVLIFRSLTWPSPRFCRPCFPCSSLVRWWPRRPSMACRCRRWLNSC